MTDESIIEGFEKNFFRGELNQMSGAGGEILVKGPGVDSPNTQMDVGDRLIGIGATQTIETLDRLPQPGTLLAPEDRVKMALRAFEIRGKTPTEGGYSISLKPLAPEEYSELITIVSQGKAKIPPETIPEGTMIMSFIAADPDYTLDKVSDSPSGRWRAVTEGVRHWNVGVASEEDFWRASFPSDNISYLDRAPISARIGRIEFGLSLLSGSQTSLKFKKIDHQSRAASKHEFCLSGAAAGTAGVDTPFPIGLRTAIRCHPY